MRPANAEAQTFSRVSVATDGTAANGHSSSPSISGDGRFVAFASGASNLVADDTNASTDIFVRDRQTNTTTRVSVTSTGEQRPGFSSSPRITPDGRFVVFHSTAALVTEDTAACPDVPLLGTPTCSDIYVHDRQTAATTRVSVSSAGGQGNGVSERGQISADGRFVVFSSTSSNLVAADANAARDAFLHDRQTGTTIRLLAPNGNPGPTGSGAPVISADGRFVAFTGSASPQETADPVACDDGPLCAALFLLDRTTDSVTLLSNTLPRANGGRDLSHVPIVSSADGGVLVISQRISDINLRFTSLRTVILDRVTGHTIVTPWQVGPGNLRVVTGLSADGRTFAAEGAPGTFRLIDRLTGFDEVVGINYTGAMPSVSADARFTAFESPHALVDDANDFLDVFVHDRDAGDGDGLPTAWEETFGLDPASAADATGDPDGDGLTNLQELAAGSHPNGTVARYFAEGAANAFFRTSFAVLNPSDTEAVALFRFLGPGGQLSSVVRALPPRSRSTVYVNGLDLAPPNDFSTVVESDHPIVVDRTVSWGDGNYGGHAETSLAAPSTTWHLAEGATHGAFDLFYLLQNPNASDAAATVTYLRLAPLAPVTKVYTVPANSRRTIWVDAEGPELEAVDVAASIASTLPIVVERAMYSTRPGQPPFAAGHGGAGVTAPALNWFLAEGATGGFFDTYVLVANPGATEAQLAVTYLLPSGAPFTKSYTVGGQQRLTISVQGEDPRLADTPVSVVVESTNNQPVVVERAMWWPKGEWYEAHLSAGATTTGTRWALAEGFVSGIVETYILIANTSPTDGTATVTLFVEGGTPVQTTVSLPRESRVNVPVSSLLPGGGAFGTVIESNGVEIVVERAIYTTVNGQVWSAGTAALGTKLP